MLFVPHKCSVWNEINQLSGLNSAGDSSSYRTLLNAEPLDGEVFPT